MSDTNTITRYKQQLMYVTNQKQQLEVQKNVLDNTIKELEKTKEKKVFRGVGNIFINSDKDHVVKDTMDLKETVELQIKNLQKQEESIIEKLNSLSKSNSEKEDSKDNNSEGIA
jgi:prefoldin beta subunit